MAIMLATVYGRSFCSVSARFFAVCLSFGVSPSPNRVSLGCITRRAILAPVVSVR